MVVKTPALEPLRDGERLSREEFHRRYAAMNDRRKCELIRGIVYVDTCDGRYRIGCARAMLSGWLGYYTAFVRGASSGSHASIFLSEIDEAQPDGMMHVPSWGNCRPTEGGFLEGPPEFVHQAVASSSVREVEARREMYRLAGIQEYLIWRVDEKMIDWWGLREGAYELLPVDEAGVIRSEVFPGLWLDTRAMLRDEGKAILATLQAGLESAEHAAFVQRLPKANPE